MALEIKESKLGSNRVKHSLEFLKTFINLGSYLLVIPFRIIEDKQGSYRLVPITKWKKVACGVSLIGCVVADFALFVQLMLSRKFSQRAPLDYFDLARRISVFAYYGLTGSLIWTKTKPLQDLFQLIQWNPPLMNSMLIPLRTSRPKLKGRMMYGIPILLFLLTHHLLLVTDSMERSNWNTNKWAEAWIKGFSSQYCLQNLPQTSVTRTGSLVLGFSLSGMAINYQYFTSWMPVAGAFVLFRVVRSAQEVQNSQVLECHECLKKASGHFNSAFGPVVFGLTFTLLPQFVFYFIELIDPPTVSRFLRNVIRFAHLSVFFGFAAVINAEKSIIHAWVKMRDNYSKLSVQELSVLIYESSTELIGIYAWGLFRLTTQVIGSVVTAVLTFSVIILQFQNAARANP